MNTDSSSSSGASPGDSIALTLATLRRELERVSAERDKYRFELESVQNAQLDSIQESLASLSQQLQRTDRRVMRNLPGQLLTDFQAMEQLVKRYTPKASLPALAGWALNPAGLLALTDVIYNINAELVVECGSGTSTLWMAYAIRQKGKGKVIALEHHPEYARRTREVIRAHDLVEFAEVRDAQLITHNTPRGDFNWYDFDPSSLHRRVDLLLVDGPPGDTGPHARYPALQNFVKYFEPGARVVLDDMHRPDEQKTLEFWLEETPQLRLGDPLGPEIAMLTFAPDQPK